LQPIATFIIISSISLLQPTMGRKPTVSTHHVSSSQSNIEVHVFEPPALANEDACEIAGTIITVHPWATLGGGEHNTIGLARYMTTKASSKSKWRVITFTLQSTPLWRGGAVWGILSKHSYEVQQVVDVAKWAIEKFGRVVMLGSSAGAPMAGSAMTQLVKEHDRIDQAEGTVMSQHKIVAYIAVGYTFGNFASLAFGQHFASIVSSGKSQPCCGVDSSTSSTEQRIPPKLFIMGENDEFTTVSQLEGMVEKMRRNGRSGRVDIEVVPNVGHFQLESPSYDSLVSKLILDWLEHHALE
jgi:hypothetical protein